MNIKIVKEVQTLCFSHDTDILRYSTINIKVMNCSKLFFNKNYLGYLIFTVTSK